MSKAAVLSSVSLLIECWWIHGGGHAGGFTGEDMREYKVVQRENASMPKCLYCNSEGDTREHVIPAAFGEFRDAPELPILICAVCNNQRLGLLDEQVARCGPEAFMREFYGVKGRAHHSAVNPFARGSAGGKRLEFSTFDREAGVEVNLEIRDGVVTQMCELILIETTTGKVHHFPLSEAMTADQLRTAVTQRAILKPYEARLSCHPDERVWVERLLQKHSPGMTFSVPKLMSHVIETPEVKFQLGVRYFRGIAKIGLHYFLTQFPKYSGYEQIFSRVRSFIYEERNEPIQRVNEFIHSRHHPLLLPMLDSDVRPDGWRAHVLAAEMRPGSCLAHIQMFLTEDNPGLIYTVNLVQNDLSVTEYAAHAHLYRYFSDGKQGKFSGEASSLPSVRLMRDFPPTTAVVKS